MALAERQLLRASRIVQIEAKHLHEPIILLPYLHDDGLSRREANALSARSCSWPDAFSGPQMMCRFGRVDGKKAKMTASS